MSETHHHQSVRPGQDQVWINGYSRSWVCMVVLGSAKVQVWGWVPVLPWGRHGSNCPPVPGLSQTVGACPVRPCPNQGGSGKGAGGAGMGKAGMGKAGMGRGIMGQGEGVAGLGR